MMQCVPLTTSEHRPTIAVVVDIGNIGLQQIQLSNCKIYL